MGINLLPRTLPLLTLYSKILRPFSHSRSNCQNLFQSHWQVSDRLFLLSNYYVVRERERGWIEIQFFQSHLNAIDWIFVWSKRESTARRGRKIGVVQEREYGKRGSPKRKPKEMVTLILSYVPSLVPVEASIGPAFNRPGYFRVMAWDLWGTSKVEFESTTYCPESEWQCDFYFGYGHDIIEENALNEKLRIEVLRRLIAKADTEIDELGKDLVSLKTELAWAEHEEWPDICHGALSEKIACLDTSIVQGQGQAKGQGLLSEEKEMFPNASLSNEEKSKRTSTSTLLTKNLAPYTIPSLGLKNMTLSEIRKLAQTLKLEDTYKLRKRELFELVARNFQV